jgi:hypothetical protein
MKQRSLYFLLAFVYFGSHQAYFVFKLLVKRAGRTGARPSGWRVDAALKRMNFFGRSGYD